MKQYCIVLTLLASLTSALLVPPSARQELSSLDSLEKIGGAAPAALRSRQQPRQLRFQDADDSDTLLLKHREKLVPVTLGVMSKCVYRRCSVIL